MPTSPSFSREQTPPLKLGLPELRQNFTSGKKSRNPQLHRARRTRTRRRYPSAERKALKRYRHLADAISTIREFAELHSRLDDLIAMNQAAMFPRRHRQIRLGKIIAYEFAVARVVLIVGAAVSWGLGGAPLEAADGTDRTAPGLVSEMQSAFDPQPLADSKQSRASSNQMAERLEQSTNLTSSGSFTKRSKTEAIIESLEDGVV